MGFTDKVSPFISFPIFSNKERGEKGGGGERERENLNMIQDAISIDIRMQASLWKVELILQKITGHRRCVYIVFFNTDVLYCIGVFSRLSNYLA